MIKKIFMVVVSSMMICGMTMASGMTDIKTSDWYYDNVSMLIEKGIVTGYPDGTYRPNGSVQVDQFIKMVIVATGNNDITNSDGYWAKDYISRAKSTGMINYTDFKATTDTYDYTKIITRAEMAKILYNALDKLKDEKKIITTEEKQKQYEGLMSDYYSISNDKQLQVAEVYAQGVLCGYPDGEFKPNNGLTRAEASTVIIRLIDKTKRQSATNQAKPKEENTLPKNYKDFYQINPNIPTRLYEYPYNLKAKYDNGAFETNKEIYDDPNNYGLAYGGTGKELLTKIKAWSNGYVDSIYNMDYTKTQDEIRLKMQRYQQDNEFNNLYISKVLKNIKDNKIISRAEFITDESLIYQDCTGSIRIRGKFRLMYISNISKKAITTDIEYNKYKDMTIEIGKWYEQDMEIRFSNSPGNGLWERTLFIWTDEISLN